MKRSNCYVSSEAVFHLLGGYAYGWCPMNMRHEGSSHWFIRNFYTGMIIDLTKSQFKTLPDYKKARGRGFLTKQPSKRAKSLMKTLVWQ
jgi:hypothetical protein